MTSPVGRVYELDVQVLLLGIDHTADTTIDLGEELAGAGEFAPTVELARVLLSDAHDLIHKSVGWMLREVAKRDEATARAFPESTEPSGFRGH